MTKTFLRITGLAVLAMLVLPALAAAADAPPLDHSLALSSTQFYALLIGAATPAVTYVLNHHAPWASEPIKALVLLVVAAAAGALAQLLDAGSLALDTNTLQVVATAVVTAFLTHAGFYRPSGIAAKLGGGTNAQGNA